MSGYGESGRQAGVGGFSHEYVRLDAEPPLATGGRGGGGRGGYGGGYGGSSYGGGAYVSRTFHGPHLPTVCDAARLQSIPVPLRILLTLWLNGAMIPCRMMTTLGSWRTTSGRSRTILWTSSMTVRRGHHRIRLVISCCDVKADVGFLTDYGNLIRQRDEEVAQIENTMIEVHHSPQSCSLLLRAV